MLAFSGIFKFSAKNITRYALGFFLSDHVYPYLVGSLDLGQNVTVFL